MKRLALSLLLLAACDQDQPAPLTTPDLAPPPPPNQGTAIVATSDFVSGALASVELGSRAVRKDLDVVDAQPVVRIYDGKVYVLDQTHGVLRVYDPAAGYKNPQEYPTGNADLPAAQANPHDVYVDRQRAYVTLYGAYMSNAVDGGHALGVIDLGKPKSGIQSFLPLSVVPADTDKNPDADRLFACGGQLFVVLQNLDRNHGYKPVGQGRLGYFDLSRAAPGDVQYISLLGQDPVAVALPGGECAQALVGHADYQIDDQPMGKGGIERVDLRAHVSMGLLLADTDLGGHVSALDAASATLAFADILSKDGMGHYQHQVFAVDLKGRKKGAQVLGPLNFVPALRVYGQQLVVLSGGTPMMGQLKAGLYLGASDGSALVPQPIEVGLPPVSMDILPR